jgi:ComF family protein
MRKRLKNFFIHNPGEWLVIPLPLHKRKKCSRGFNQNDLVSAECFKESTGAVSITLYLGKNNPLERIKDTKSQTTLNGMQRIENVKKSFCVKNADSVKNKRILLIDDIITTGATLKEAANTLSNAGADAVWGCVLAKD